MSASAVLGITYHTSLQKMKLRHTLIEIWRPLHIFTFNSTFASSPAHVFVSAPTCATDRTYSVVDNEMDEDDSAVGSAVEEESEMGGASTFADQDEVMIPCMYDSLTMKSNRNKLCEARTSSTSEYSRHRGLCVHIMRGV